MGRYIHKGYALIHRPDHPHAGTNGYVPEHRLVMEEKIGRYLERYEQVHHINHNPLDNRIENLQLLTKSEHTTLHNRVDMTGRICTLCKSSKTRFRADRPGSVPKWCYWQGELVCNKCYDRQRYILITSKR